MYLLIKRYIKSKCMLLGRDFVVLGISENGVNSRG
ncbi:hypothetical protein SAMN05444349_107135 [Bacteroides faecichinchillae]|uniref:Uncharacterized protein n=1 Tax=Bacteroides faecichinchillae TaxID=871325 RepID=A0A1M4X3S9_9BACE|nr:hypothetical protein SAMN05444349_107135 [Bacteroides faecichinchillae]